MVRLLSHYGPGVCLYFLLALLAFSSSVLSGARYPRTDVFIQHAAGKSGKVTGKTTIDYRKEQGGLSQSNISVDEKGKLVSKEYYQYDTKGNLISYQGELIKDGLEVFFIVRGDKIECEIKKGDQVITETFDSREREPVMLTNVWFYISNNLEKLVRDKSLEFEFFLPVILLEADRSNLPSSLSFVTIKAVLKSDKGNELKVHIRPKSFFVRMLLPDEKEDVYLTFNKKTGEMIELEVENYRYTPG